MALDPSPYALTDLLEVRTFLGYAVDDSTERDDTIQRGINSASVAIARRAERDFVVTEARQSTSFPRWKRIEDADVNRGYVRVGDMHDAPTEVALLSPDRNASSDPQVLDPDTDFWLLPDFPEPGMPFESIKVVSTAGPLVTGWWMRVKSISWGFDSVPEDIIAACVACAAAYVTNDPLKQSEQSAETGKRASIANIILPEWEETIDNYRIYQVS